MQLGQTKLKDLGLTSLPSGDMEIYMVLVSHQGWDAQVVWSQKGYQLLVKIALKRDNFSPFFKTVFGKYLIIATILKIILGFFFKLKSGHTKDKVLIWFDVKKKK